jgi:YfiH family protein
LADIDGLVTNEKNVVLSTSYADCVPLFFVDERNEAIGLSHSGWRGTVGKIGAKTVEKMKKEFGTNPNDLKVMIGPSICQDCYEVSQDVKEAFDGFVSVETIMQMQQKERDEVEQMLKSVFIDKPMKKYQLDLWMANKLILMEAGIPEEQIGVSCVCTCCNSTLLYSHRASQGKRGNLSAFLEII